MPDRLRPIDQRQEAPAVNDQRGTIEALANIARTGIAIHDNVRVAQHMDNVDTAIEGVEEDVLSPALDAQVEDLSLDPVVRDLQRRAKQLQQLASQRGRTGAARAQLKIKQELSQAIDRNPRLAESLISATNQVVGVSPAMENLKQASQGAAASGQMLKDIKDQMNSLGLPAYYDPTNRIHAEIYVMEAERAQRLASDTRLKEATLASNEVPATVKAQAFIEGMVGPQSSVGNALLSAVAPLSGSYDLMVQIGSGASIDPNTIAQLDIAKQQTIDSLTRMKIGIQNQKVSGFNALDVQSDAYQAVTSAADTRVSQIDQIIAAIQQNDVSALQMLEQEEAIYQSNIAREYPNTRRFGGIIDAMGGAEVLNVINSTFRTDASVQFMDTLSKYGMAAQAELLNDSNKLVTDTFLYGDPESRAQGATDQRTRNDNLRSRGRGQLSPELALREAHQSLAGQRAVLERASGIYADPAQAALNLNTMAIDLDTLRSRGDTSEIGQDLVYGTLASPDVRTTIDNLAKKAEFHPKMQNAGNSALEYMTMVHPNTQSRNVKLISPFQTSLGVGMDGNQYTVGDFVRVDQEALKEGSLRYSVDEGAIKAANSGPAASPSNNIIWTRTVREKADQVAANVNRQVNTYVTIDKLRNPTRSGEQPFAAALEQNGYGAFLEVGTTSAN